MRNLLYSMFKVTLVSLFRKNKCASQFYCRSIFFTSGIFSSIFLLAVFSMFNLSLHCKSFSFISTSSVHRNNCLSTHTRKWSSNILLISFVIFGFWSCEIKWKFIGWKVQRQDSVVRVCKAGGRIYACWFSFCILCFITAFK